MHYKALTKTGEEVIGEVLSYDPWGHAHIYNKKKKRYTEIDPETLERIED